MVVKIWYINGSHALTYVTGDARCNLFVALGHQNTSNNVKQFYIAKPKDGISLVFILDYIHVFGYTLTTQHLCNCLELLSYIFGQIRLEMIKEKWNKTLFYHPRDMFRHIAQH